MAKIKCPNCNQEFDIDESEYALLLNSVKNEEFNKEIEKREKEIKETIQSSEQLKSSQSIANKEKEIINLNNRIKELSNELSGKDKEYELHLKVELSNLESKKNDEINALKNKLDLANADKEKAILEEKNKSSFKIQDLENKIENQNANAKLNETHIKESYETQIKLLNEELQNVKDFKAKQSAKMIGESLEQFCMNEFNKIRAAAYPKAYFEKDNTVSASGSKGDFIFKDYTPDGTEYISIMFEMKNEADTTATKHKNEDFFKELDKDRREKNCEYAVLVSMLDAENDFYNIGIVEAPSIYEKMYVVRPQFFLQIISLLRNAALNTISYKLQLDTYKNRNIDVTNFEEKLQAAKDKIEGHYNKHTQKISDAIEEIDKAIKKLQDTRDKLLSAGTELTRANNDLMDITVSRLTRGNDTMKQLFKAAKEKEIDEL